MYIRISISAQSAASTPPAPERMVTSASRSSYSPDSSVRTSIASMSACSAFSSASASASDSAPPSSSANSYITGRSSSLPRNASTRRSSPWAWDRSLVTFWALAWSSHRFGSEAADSSFSILARSPSMSSTRSTVVRVVSRAAISV